MNRLLLQFRFLKILNLFSSFQYFYVFLQHNVKHYLYNTKLHYSRALKLFTVRLYLRDFKVSTCTQYNDYRNSTIWNLYSLCLGDECFLLNCVYYNIICAVEKIPICQLPNSIVDECHRSIVRYNSKTREIRYSTMTRKIILREKLENWGFGSVRSRTKLAFMW